MSGWVEGRVVVVTGAGSGLGRSHALALAEAGATVVVNDVVPAPDGTSRAEVVAAEIRDRGGAATAFTTSVNSWAGAEDLVEHAVTEHGRVDAVVANAGVLLDAMVGNMSEEIWREVVDVNLTGTFTVARAAWPHMVRQGFGRLVLTTSASGMFGNRGHANYGASKAGVFGLARMLAVEGAEHGIAANAVAPLALTPMSGDTSGSRTSAASQLGDLFAQMAPGDVSPLVVWLCSPECETTGQAFSAGGGRIARIFVGESRGWVGGRAPDVERIRHNWAAVCATEGFHEPVGMVDELAIYARELRAGKS
ncbi:SDR family NAD(P)-dependent oxidoreductase [Pseudonocardia sp. NPDC049154]|uniref:SDR family NAD(P)-dependent oxidoreductase n=1 Tax=Pseudonocardia sp. NPDC049154 TaxID=3155501 RepID=UPI0033D5553D